MKFLLALQFSLLLLSVWIVLRVRRRARSPSDKEKSRFEIKQALVLAAWIVATYLVLWRALLFVVSD